MWKVYCNDKTIGCLTTVNIFKDTEENALKEFNEYYANKYDFVKIVSKNNKWA